MTDLDTVTALAREIARTLQPIAAAFEIPDVAPDDFIAGLGWFLDTVPATFMSLQDPVSQALGLADPEDDDASIDTASLLEALAEVFQAIAAIGTDQTLPDDFRTQFPDQLIQDLLVRYLLGSRARIGYLLMLLGIISEDEVPATDTRPAYLRRTFRFDGFAGLLSDPLGTLESTYGWGQSDFAANRLFDSLVGLFSYSAWCVVPDVLDEVTAANLNQGALQPDTTTDSVLFLTMFGEVQSSDPINAGAGLFIVPETAASKPGFALLPFATDEFSVPLPLTDQINLVIGGTLDLTGGVGLIVRPDTGIQFLSGLSSASPPPAQGQLSIQLNLQNAGTPFTLLGSPDASRLELAGVSTRIGTRLSAAQKLDIFAEFSLEQAKLVIQPDAGSFDGFLASVLPAGGMQLDLSPTLGVSTERGLYFTGANNLDIDIPLHVSLGPVEVQSVQLSVSPANGAVIADLGATFKTTLGVVDAVISNVGIRASFSSPPGRNGNLGPLQLDLGVRAPDGVALSLDAQGVISGGGFLVHDDAQGLYAGGMQLSLHESITLTGYGLIATRLPDGSNGFSLLIFITAEDFQPIPLGLGLTLLGIGGMIGVNRTFDQNVLTQDMKSGALATILFPPAPAANPTAVLQALGSAFPALRGSYLLGLVAKIGWLTPALVVMDLALILEFGGRNRLLALGRISALLPSTDDDLVRINMDSVGVIDFDNDTASLDAVLVDSRLAHQFPITGAAALRANFGSGAGQSFVLAVGGLNPNFSVPVGLPALDRVAIALSSGNNPRLICEAYFAITSNTIQFGARASLYAAAGPFSVNGDVGFDVLLTLAPLHFIADYHAQVQLKLGSSNLFMVRLDGQLEGPRPLRVSGKATFEILFCHFSVRFDTTLIAGEVPPPPPAVDVMQQLTAALVAPSSWSVDRSNTDPQGVTLRNLPSSSTTLVLDPSGLLTVKQQVVPLNLTRDIDIFNGAPVSGDRRFTLTASIGGTAPPSSSVQETFAPAQYFNMTDDERLTAPSFEEMDAGCMFGDPAVTFSQALPAPVGYQTIFIQPPAAAASPSAASAGSPAAAAPAVAASVAPPPYTLTAAQLQTFSRSGSAARAPLRQVGRARFRKSDPVPAATLNAKRWSIVPLAAGAPASLAPTVRTWSEYNAALKSLNRGGATWQLIPTYEIAS